MSLRLKLEETGLDFFGLAFFAVLQDAVRWLMFVTLSYVIKSCQSIKSLEMRLALLSMFFGLTCGFSLLDDS
jgi:hypothetical protein